MTIQIPPPPEMPVLEWFHNRIVQYMANSGLSNEEAIKRLKAIRSFKERSALIDSYVDEKYKLANIPTPLPKKRRA